MFFYYEETEPAYVNNANIDTSQSQPGEIVIEILGND